MTKEHSLPHKASAVYLFCLFWHGMASRTFTISQDGIVCIPHFYFLLWLNWSFWVHKHSTEEKPMCGRKEFLGWNQPEALSFCAQCRRSLSLCLSVSLSLSLSLYSSLSLSLSLYTLKVSWMTAASERLSRQKKGKTKNMESRVNSTGS